MMNELGIVTSKTLVTMMALAPIPDEVGIPLQEDHYQ